MLNEKHCCPVTIAQNPVAHLQMCEHCGCISLHLTNITLRLDAACLRAVQSAVDEAMASIALMPGGPRAGAELS